MNIIVDVVIILLFRPSKFQHIRERELDLHGSLILNDKCVDCFESKDLKNYLVEYIDILQQYITHPITGHTSILDPLGDVNSYYETLQDIKNHIRSISCKKKVIKKGVLKKIKKYATTETPKVKEEEGKAAEESINSDNWDGWTTEHLREMVTVYGEIQKLLSECKELAPS